MKWEILDSVETEGIATPSYLCQASCCSATRTTFVVRSTLPTTGENDGAFEVKLLSPDTQRGRGFNRFPLEQLLNLFDRLIQFLLFGIKGRVANAVEPIILGDIAQDIFRTT